MSSSEDVKAFLYSWCGRQKLGAPVYDCQSTGARGGRVRFKCELRIAGHHYIGLGNSTSKKDAMSNAARDFCGYLSRLGVLDPASIPAFTETSLETVENPGLDSSNWTSSPALPAQTAIAPAPFKTQHEDYVQQLADEVAQSESVDFRADIHGGWTMENCKQRLNEFAQKTKQQLLYTYQPVGPDHSSDGSDDECSESW